MIYIDTPMTNDRVVIIDGNPWVNAPFAQSLEHKLNAANHRIKRLEDWKQSALEIEREWDANAIATMLGGKLGESQRKVIQREVPKLLARIKRLEEAGDGMADLLEEEMFMKLAVQWREAKECKL